MHRAFRYVITGCLEACVFFLLFTDRLEAQSGLFVEPNGSQIRPVEQGNWLIGSWRPHGPFECAQLSFEVAMAATNRTNVAQIYDPISGQHFLIKAFEISTDVIEAKPLFFPPLPYGTSIVARKINSSQIIVESIYGQLIMDRCPSAGRGPG